MQPLTRRASGRRPRQLLPPHLHYHHPHHPHHQTCDKCKLKQVQVTETGRIDLDRATHREYSSVKPRNTSAESCFTPFHVVVLGSSCPFQVEHHRTCTIFTVIHKKWLKMSSDEVLGQIWKSNGWQGKIFEQFETAPAVCLTQLIWFRLTGRTQWIDMVLTFIEKWWHQLQHLSYKWSMH